MKVLILELGGVGAVLEIQGMENGEDEKREENSKSREMLESVEGTGCGPSHLVLAFLELLTTI